MLKDLAKIYDYLLVCFTLMWRVSVGRGEGQNNGTVISVGSNLIELFVIWEKNRVCLGC